MTSVVKYQDAAGRSSSISENEFAIRRRSLARPATDDDFSIGVHYALELLSGGD